MDHNSASAPPTAANWRHPPQIIKQAIGIFAAGLLAWLSFRGADLGAVMSYTSNANPGYLGLLCLSVLASHILRAGRWLILMRPLTEKKISLWNSFCAIIYGYAVNIIVPRGGEIVRLVYICKAEGLPWAGVLPTLLIDRLLDLVILAFLFGYTLISLPPALLTGLPWLYSCGISLTISTVLLFVLLPVLPKIISFFLSIPQLNKLIQPQMMTKINNLLQQFEQGNRCLTNLVTYPLILLFSVGIWLFYWLNFYFVLSAFGLNEKLSLGNELVSFTVASLGVLVPTPGCVGGFHFLVSKCLVLIGGVNQNLALAVATVLHALAFVIIISLTALVCFLWQHLRHPGNKDKNGPNVQ